MLRKVIPRQFKPNAKFSLVNEVSPLRYRVVSTDEAKTLPSSR